MNTSRLLYLLVVTTATIMKANAEADDHSILAQGLSGLRGKYIHPVGKKEESVEQNERRILNRATANIFSRTREDDNLFPFFDCDDEGDDNGNEIEEEDVHPLSASPSASAATESPTANPTYGEKKLFASDGEQNDYFGSSCSMTDDLVVIGAYGDDTFTGAAYLFRLDGTEVSKLEPGDDGNVNTGFGSVIAIDEKIVIGVSQGGYLRVFSRQGTYERTITPCDGCTLFGMTVATHGDKILTGARQDSVFKFLIYTTEGNLLKAYEQSYMAVGVAMTNDIIVSTVEGAKTSVYSNVAPDFPLIREIDQGGRFVAASGDKVIIGDHYANTNVGSAWLYNIDGTLVKELEHDITSTNSNFGQSIAISEQYVLVGAQFDDIGDSNTGSVFIYTTDTGDQVEKVLAPDAETNDGFGSSVCISDSYFGVGASRVDSIVGAAYLFNLPA